MRSNAKSNNINFLHTIPLSDIAINYSGRGQLGKSSNEYPLIVVLVVFVVLNHIYLKLMPFHSAAFTFQNGNNTPLFFRIATLRLKASPRHNSERDTKCSDTL